MADKHYKIEYNHDTRVWELFVRHETALSVWFYVKDARMPGILFGHIPGSAAYYTEKTFYVGVVD